MLDKEKRIQNEKKFGKWDDLPMAEEGIILRAVLKIQSNCHSEERSDEKSRFFSQNEEQDSSLRSE